MVLKNFSARELRQLSGRDVLLKNVLFGKFEGANHFRDELNKWINLFERKGFWTTALEKRILGSRDWYQFYSITTELKLGYFLEKNLNIELLQYEPKTVANKSCDFKVSLNSEDCYVELKTTIEENKRKRGSFNASNKIVNAFTEAVRQLPSDKKNILFISNDLEVSLFYDTLAQTTVHKLLRQHGFKKISAVCLFGDIYLDSMYKLLYVINPSAENPVPENIFKRYKKINKL